MLDAQLLPDVVEQEILQHVDVVQAVKSAAPVQLGARVSLPRTGRDMRGLLRKFAQ